MPRAIAAALMLVIVVTSCGALVYTLQGQALTVIDQLPVGARKLAASLRKIPGAEPGAVEKVQQAADELAGAEKPSAPSGVTRVQIEERGFQASTFVWSTSVGAASAANQLIMVLFLTYFMLLSDQLFKRKLVEIVGTLSQKKVTVTVLEDIARQIEQFLVIQLATSAVVAVATGVALWGLGHLGVAAGGANDDGDQGHLRSRGATAARRTSSGRLGCYGTVGAITEAWPQASISTSHGVSAVCSPHARLFP